MDYRVIVIIRLIKINIGIRLLEIIPSMRNHNFYTDHRLRL